MWTVIYIAPTQEIAEKYQLALAQEGILAQLRSSGSEQKKSNKVSTEIAVPVSEAEEAQEILLSIISD
ncbi:MAG: glutamate decarboxylase [Desulfitobacteriia bacterium]|jgi:hypothetical protein